jgi:tetratricopeptide (TPR) repeat protein
MDRTQLTPDPWQPHSRTYRASKFLRRNAIAVTSAAAVALAMITLVAFYTRHPAAGPDAGEPLTPSQGMVNERHDADTISLAALANGSREQPEPLESEQLYRAFIEQQIPRLGRDHLLLGRAQNNLGTVLRAKGDYAGAQRAFEEALRIYALQPDDLDVDKAVAHHNLGALHHESGDLPRALREINEALSWKVWSGHRGPALVSSLMERAGILRAMGQLVSAEAALLEAESIANERLGAEDRRHALLQLERGRFLFAAGRTREALQELQSAVHGLRTQQDPARLADALASLGETLAADAKFEAARDAVAEALSIRQRVLPGSHPAIAATQSQMARFQTRVTPITP